ncbi:hypothetical protein QTP88_019186 [Uroleucon formosanum]
MNMFATRLSFTPRKPDTANIGGDKWVLSVCVCACRTVLSRPWSDFRHRVSAPLLCRFCPFVAAVRIRPDCCCASIAVTIPRGFVVCLSSQLALPVVRIGAGITLYATIAAAFIICDLWTWCRIGQGGGLPPICHSVDQIVVAAAYQD